MSVDSSHANEHAQAQRLLEETIVHFNGKPIGTLAANDNSVAALNYDQVFVRDFMVSAIYFLLQGRCDIVREFLLATAEMQSNERQFDCFKPGQGLIPASFKVVQENATARLLADFGEHAIARVAPVDSGFWWLLILRAYRNISGDQTLVDSQAIQVAIRKILELCLTTRFDMFPTMLVPDGAYTIDRRMGVYGYPVDIESLFFAALRAAEALLTDTDSNRPFREAAHTRSEHLAFHIRQYYWLDLDQLNRIYRYGVEEYGAAAANKFNIYPETIPLWLMDWLPEEGGYFAGNVGPGRMDYRFFAQGNLLAIISGLATANQASALMALLRTRYQDLIGAMPMKLSYPALEGNDWALLTGMDPKNRPWSYHNGGHWPFMLWLLAAACGCSGEPELLDRALASAGWRLARDDWPEYYDGRAGRLVGRQARLRQTWTLAGYLAAAHLQAHPEHIRQLGFGDQATATACTVGTG